MRFLFTYGATTLLEVVKVLEKEKTALKDSLLFINNDLVTKLKANMDESPYRIKGIEELVWKDDGKTIAIIDLEYSTSKCRKVYRIFWNGLTIFNENNTFPTETVILQ